MNLEMTVREWLDSMSINRLDSRFSLSGGWTVGISRGIYSTGFDFMDYRLSEDVFYVSWREWRKSRSVNDVSDRKIIELVDEWKEAVRLKVRNYLQCEENRLRGELVSLNELSELVSQS